MLDLFEYISAWTFALSLGPPVAAGVEGPPRTAAAQSCPALDTDGLGSRWQTTTTRTVLFDAEYQFI